MGGICIKPLYDKLTQHKNDGSYPFAMPGHKGKTAFFPLLHPRMDVTELDGFDNLHHAEGVIAQMQQNIAALTGAEAAYALVGGSSSGNMAALLACLQDGDEVLLSRNCHLSVYRGLVLTGAVPVYLTPEREADFAGPVAPKTVEAALAAHPKAKAVVLVSPTYEGLCCDLAAIADLVHAKNIPLIVDEAHGAHFGFDPHFPQSAIAQGADIAVQSWHKTLPSPTMTAVLLTQGERIDRTRLEEALRTVQSTSPSYLLMAAIDHCCHLLTAQGAALFADYAKNLFALREKLQGLNNISLLPCGPYADAGKLVLLPKNATGTALKEALLAHGLYMEAAGPKHVLAMTSVADEAADFDRLYAALKEIDEVGLPEETVTLPPVFTQTPTALRTPRAAYFAPKVRIPLTEAAGRVSMGFLTPYPPGIPLAAPGEILTKEAADYLQLCLAQGIEVLGVADGCVLVEK